MADTSKLVSEQCIDPVDLSQSLQIGISQLNAMLFATYGDSGDRFRELNDEIQDFFMWGLQEKAASLARMAEDLSSALLGTREEVPHG
jgi:hypothetical protein